MFDFLLKIEVWDTYIYKVYIILWCYVEDNLTLNSSLRKKTMSEDYHKTYSTHHFFMTKP